MEIFRKLSILVLFCVMIISSEIIHTYGDENNNVQENEKNASPTQMLEEAYSMLLTSTLRSLDVAKSYINQLQQKYFPPNVDFRKDDGNVNGGAGERIMDATQKSFQKSKETVEGSAKSAAEALGQKVHKTAEKVKDKMSQGHKTVEDTLPSGHDEL